MALYLIKNREKITHISPTIKISNSVLVKTVNVPEILVKMLLAVICPDEFSHLKEMAVLINF
jgi:hypothetical protein